MKKVLIIAFSFKNNIIGAVRSRGLAKYLPRFGWEPTILTVKRPGDIDPNFRLVETDYEDEVDKWKGYLNLKPQKPPKNPSSIQNESTKNPSSVQCKSTKNPSSVQNKPSKNQGQDRNKGIDLVFKLWVEIFTYPHEKKNWHKTAIESADNLLKTEDFQAIISVNPIISHIIANDLKNEHNIPWIADLRDLWSQNHSYKYSRFRRFFDTRLEKKVLNNADAITTVSEPLKDNLCRNYPANKVSVIPNGFDPDESYSSELGEKFNITFTGTIYKENNDIKPLFGALSELIEEGKINIQDVSLDFYGNTMDTWICEHAESYDLQSLVHFNGLVPRKEAMTKQKSSQLLLLLDWTNCNEKGIITGKIFEYLAAQRPIIATGPCKDVVSDLLRETGSGVHLSTVDEIKDQINSYYGEYLQNGKVKYDGIPEKIEKYSQIGMARKFAFILDDIT